MAVLTFESDVYTAQNATPPTKQQPSQLHGRVRCVHVNIDAPSTAGDANSLGNLCKIPAGARVLPMSKLYHGALGTGRTMDVGWTAYDPEDGGSQVAADVDGLADGADVSSAGSFNLDINKNGVTFTGEALLQAKCLGGTWPTTNGWIRGDIFYVLD